MHPETPSPVDQPHQHTSSKEYTVRGESWYSAWGFGRGDEHREIEVTPSWPERSRVNVSLAGWGYDLIHEKGGSTIIEAGSDVIGGGFSSEPWVGEGDISIRCKSISRSDPVKDDFVRKIRHIPGVESVYRAEMPDGYEMYWTVIGQDDRDTKMQIYDIEGEVISGNPEKDIDFRLLTSTSDSEFTTIPDRAERLFKR